MTDQKANLLLITFDQWRGDWGDPYAPVVNLPGITGLAQKGWTARRCYTSSPQCVPARLSWITGLYPSQLGVTRNCPAHLPADAPSLVRELQQKGWRTELVGKTHWTNHRGHQDLNKNKRLLKALGFDQALEIAGPRALQTVDCDLVQSWKKAGVHEKYQEDLAERYGQGRSPNAWKVKQSVLPNELYPDLWIANRAIEKIESLPSTQPWLLWVSFVGPHDPFDTPAPWHGQHQRTELPEATPRPSWIQRLPDHSELKKIQMGWQGHLTHDAIDALRRDYADHLVLLDEQMQRLEQAVRSRTDRDNTAIAVTADHGEMLGDGGMLYKSTFLESSIRVPMIYVAPTQLKEKKTRTENPVSLTNCFKLILQTIQTGGGSQDIQEKIEKKKKVIVEFGNEILLIRNSIKICFDRDGHQGNDRPKSG